MSKHLYNSRGSPLPSPLSEDANNSATYLSEEDASNRGHQSITNTVTCSAQGEPPKPALHYSFRDHSHTSHRDYTFNFQNPLVSSPLRRDYTLRDNTEETPERSHLYSTQHADLNVLRESPANPILQEGRPLFFVAVPLRDKEETMEENMEEKAYTNEKYNENNEAENINEAENENENQNKDENENQNEDENETKKEADINTENENPKERSTETAKDRVRARAIARAIEKEYRNAKKKEKKEQKAKKKEKKKENEKEYNKAIEVKRKEKDKGTLHVVVAYQGNILLEPIIQGTPKRDLRLEPEEIQYVLNVQSPTIFKKSKGVLVIGGFLNGEPTNKGVYVRTKSFRANSTPVVLPIPLAGFSVVTIQKKETYLFGGCTLSAHSGHPQLQMNTEVFIRSDAKWKQLHRYQGVWRFPPVRAFAATASNGTQAFIHGGVICNARDAERQTLSDIWECTAGEAIAWKRVDAFGSAPTLYKHTCHFVGGRDGKVGRLFFVGGFFGDGTPNTSMVYAFDIFTRSWIIVDCSSRNFLLPTPAVVGSIIHTHISKPLLLNLLVQAEHSWQVVQLDLNTKDDGIWYNLDLPYFSKNTFFLSEVQNKREVTSTNFSKVLAGTYKGHPVVLKMWNYTEGNLWADYLDDVYRELASINLTSKDGLLASRPIMVSIQSPQVAMMFDLHRPLCDAIAQAPLSLDSVLQFSLDIAFTMLQLFDCELIHGDIKAENCLINEHSDLVLCDFGLMQSCFKPKGKFYSPHAAPELHSIISPSKDLRSADIYAFAYTVWQMLTPNDRTYPCPENAASTSFYGLHPEIPADCPQKLRNLVVECWNTDYTKRPQIQEIVHKLQKLARNSVLHFQWTANNHTQCHQCHSVIRGPLYGCAQCMRAECHNCIFDHHIGSNHTIAKIAESRTCNYMWTNEFMKENSRKPRNCGACNQIITSDIYFRCAYCPSLYFCKGCEDRKLHKVERQYSVGPRYWYHPLYVLQANVKYIQLIALKRIGRFRDYSKSKQIHIYEPNNTPHSTQHNGIPEPKQKHKHQIAVLNEEYMQMTPSEKMNAQLELDESKKEEKEHRQDHAVRRAKRAEKLRRQKAFDKENKSKKKGEF